MQYYNVRYSITLNDAQLDYLSDEDQEINRMMCFKTFLRMATKEDTIFSKKNFSAGISIGQFAVCKVELAELWHCNRKTATRIIKEFNAMDILTSFANNRTTIHTLNCLSVWFTRSGCIHNSHFKINPVVRPFNKKAKPTKKTVHVPAANCKGNTTDGEGNNIANNSASLNSNQNVSADACRNTAIHSSNQTEWKCG